MTTNLSEFLSSTYTGKRGFGLFNTEIDQKQSYTCTNTLASALTFSGVDQKFLVRSILLTNTSGSDETFSASVFFDSDSSEIVIANQIPLNSGSTIELIKKPKVFESGDEIKLVASSNTAVDAYITYQSDSSLNYFGEGVKLTTADNTDVFVASSGDAVLESIHVANIIGAPVDIDIFIAESNGTPISYIAKNYVIPANAVIELNEQPKLLDSGQKIIAKAPAGNIFTILVSGIYR